MTVITPLIRDILNDIDRCTILYQAHQIVFANTTACDWFKLSLEELQSHSFKDFLHADSHDEMKYIHAELLAGQDAVSTHVRLLHPTSGDVWIDATLKLPSFVEENGFWLMTFEQAQQTNNHYQVDNIAVAGNVSALLEHRNLARFDAFRNEYDGFDLFFEILQQQIPFTSASLAVVTDVGLTIVASHGFPQELVLSAPMVIERDGSIFTIADLLYQDHRGSVRVVQDTAQHPNWVHVEETDYIRAWMGMELTHHETVIGYLNLDADTPNFFTEQHAKDVLSLSRQAMLSLAYNQLKQMFAQEYDDHRRLQGVLVKNLVSTETMFTAQALLYNSTNFADILTDLISIVASSMDDTEIIMLVFNPVTNRLMHRIQSHTLDVDLWSVFAEISGIPDLQEDTIPPDELQLPPDGLLTLQNGSQTIAGAIDNRGALIAIRESDAELFDETDHELIVTIANQISITLENERLDAQVRQHTQHLERMFDRSSSQLAVERKRLQAILDSTAEGIFYMENFKLQYANPAFCKMVGYELDEIYGKPLSFLRVTQDANTEAHNFNSLLDNPLEVKHTRSETRLRHRDGAEFYASIRFSLVGVPGEDPVRMVAIARDVSQERKLYIQRARFIANAAHELRTPLSSLILRLHMLRRQPERSDVHLSSLDKVTNYLKELVEELLTLSRFERGSIVLEKDVYNLTSIIEQAISENMPFAEEQQVILDVDIPDQMISMTIDGTRMHQMVSNLVVNGINYSAPEQHVQIKLTVEVDPVGNENVILYVTDEGEGIEPDLLPDDIFEPFARPSGGKRKETGMGLALVKEIVNLHGGSIHVRSKLGEGSSFRVSLPLN